MLGDKVSIINSIISNEQTSGKLKSSEAIKARRLQLEKMSLTQLSNSLANIKEAQKGSINWLQESFAQAPTKPQEGSVWGNSLKSAQTQVPFAIEKQKNPQPQEKTYSPLQQRQLRQDAADFLFESSSEARQLVIKQGEENGFLGTMVDGFKAMFVSETQGRKVADLVENEYEGAQKLKRANASGKGSFEYTFKKERGIEFNPANVENFQKASKKYMELSAYKEKYDVINGELDAFKKEWVTSHAPKQRSASSTQQQIPSITTDKRFNKILDEICDGNKDLKAKYVQKLNSTGTGLQGFSNQIKELNRLQGEIKSGYQKQLGGKDFAYYENNYNNSMKKAFGEKNAKGLAQAYAQSQKQGIMYSEIGITIATTMLLGGSNLVAQGGAKLATQVGTKAATQMIKGSMVLTGAITAPAAHIANAATSEDGITEETLAEAKESLKSGILYGGIGAYISAPLGQLVGNLVKRQPQVISGAMSKVFSKLPTKATAVGFATEVSADTLIQGMISDQNLGSAFAQNGSMEAVMRMIAGGRAHFAAEGIKVSQTKLNGETTYEIKDASGKVLGATKDANKIMDVLLNVGELAGAAKTESANTVQAKQKAKAPTLKSPVVEAITSDVVAQRLKDYESEITAPIIDKIANTNTTDVKVIQGRLEMLSKLDENTLSTLIISTAGDAIIAPEFLLSKISEVEGLYKKRFSSDKLDRIDYGKTLENITPENYGYFKSLLANNQMSQADIKARVEYSAKPHTVEFGDKLVEVNSEHILGLLTGRDVSKGDYTGFNNTVNSLVAEGHHSSGLQYTDIAEGILTQKPELVAICQKYGQMVGEVLATRCPRAESEQRISEIPRILEQQGVLPQKVSLRTIVPDENALMNPSATLKIFAERNQNKPQANEAGQIVPKAETQAPFTMGNHAKQKEIEITLKEILKNDPYKIDQFSELFSNLDKLDYANIDRHLKNIKIFMECTSNNKNKIVKNGYFYSKDGAEAFELLLTKYDTKPNREGQVSPITMVLNDYEPSTIITAQKRNLLGNLKNVDRVKKLSQMTDEEFINFQARAEKTIRDTGSDFNKLSLELNKELTPLIDKRYLQDFQNNYVNKESIVAQLQLLKNLKNFPVEVKDSELMTILKNVDLDNINSCNEIINKLKNRSDISASTTSSILKVSNKDTEKLLMDLIDIQDVPINKIITICKFNENFEKGLVSKSTVIEKINNDPYVKTIRAIKNNKAQFSSTNTIPTKLNPLKIESSALALVHMTEYKPDNGMISSTRDKIGGSRNSVHFTLNHPVENHRLGDWDNCKYAIIMPYSTAVKANSKGKFVEGMPNDLYTNGSVKIPESSVIVTQNTNLAAGTINIIKHPTIPGVNVIETSLTPHEIMPNILEKMGYNHVKGDGLVGMFNSGKNNGKSVDAAMENYTAWKDFCNKEGLKPTIHTASPAGIAEACIEDIGKLCVNNRWEAKSGFIEKTNFRKELLEKLVAVKSMQAKGYYVSFNIDKLTRIVQESKSPKTALGKIKSELGFEPTVKYKEFHECDFDSSIKLYKEWWNATDDPKLLKKYFEDEIAY